MDERFLRTENLIGKDALLRLKHSSVAVFGIGGVGGFAAEALARAGVGSLTLVDNDVVAASNINRQLVAFEDTVGQYKTDVMRDIIKRISPETQVTALRLFYLPETAGQIDLKDFDYIVDAVDNVTAKLELAVRAKACGVRIISSMGTGNKLDPSRLAVADVFDTSVCPLARVMRRELKKRGVDSLKVVYSDEPPMESFSEDKKTPASMIFVPGCAGLLLAGTVVKDLIY